MFEQLLDPHPPELGDEFRDRVIADGRRRQRRTRLAVGGAVLAPLVAVGGFAVYLRGQADELERIPVDGLTPATQATTTEDTTAQDTASSSPRITETTEAPAPPPIAAPTNILVVGVDRRPPSSNIEGSRADTIGVVRIDPDLHRVSLLSLPRDLWITIDDGRSNRINAFTDDAGLVPVVSDLLDVDINHYIEIDFDGFISLIDIAGGVTVPFDQPVRDMATGFAADAGCNHLTGTEALAYARSRKLATLDPNTQTWTIDGSADIGRIARQQDLIERVYATVLEQNYTTADQIRLLNDVVDDITVDDGLDLDGLRAIFNATAGIGLDNFTTYDLTTSLKPVMIQGNSVLLADPDGIATTTQQFRGNNPNNNDTANPTIRLDTTTQPSSSHC
ncbi:MAG: LCP family protein [Actinomycetota bacterium]